MTIKSIFLLFSHFMFFLIIYLDIGRLKSHQCGTTVQQYTSCLLGIFMLPLRQDLPCVAVKEWTSRTLIRCDWMDIHDLTSPSWEKCFTKFSFPRAVTGLPALLCLRLAFPEITALTITNHQSAFLNWPSSCRNLTNQTKNGNHQPWAGHSVTILGK